MEVWAEVGVIGIGAGVVLEVLGVERTGEGSLGSGQLEEGLHVSSSCCCF